MKKERLQDELLSFQNLWHGGYFEGDCLDPMARSGYGQLGYISALHATYLRCIKPYVNEETVSLEIGAGRGGWTKALLPSREVHALDALPKEHNHFFEYLGYPKNVKYHQVDDFKCEMLSDDYFTYMFSFGCLCHVSFEGIQEYAIHIYPKLKRGANCFWMVADYDKYNRAVADLRHLSIYAGLMPRSKKCLILQWFLRYLMHRKNMKKLLPDANSCPMPGRWYHAGTERTCSMLKDVGYQIIDADVGTCLRDPIINFRKPD